MPGPLTKSVCVLYLTFSRANSMLCLPSARRELGAASRQGRQRGLPRRAPPPGADACGAGGSGDGQAWLTRESGSALPCPSPARLRAGAVALQACGDRGELRGRARQAPACHSLCQSGAGPCRCLRCVVPWGPGALAPHVPAAHGYLGAVPCLGHPTQSPALGADPAVAVGRGSLWHLARSRRSAAMGPGERPTW